MSNEEKEEFQIDVTQIDWHIVIKDFLFGIRRFYFREDVLPPESQFKQILAKTRIELFHDARIALKHGNNIYTRNNREYFPKILSLKKFNAFLKQYYKIAAPNNKNRRNNTGTNLGADVAYVTENRALPLNIDLAKV